MRSKVRNFQTTFDTEMDKACTDIVIEARQNGVQKMSDDALEHALELISAGMLVSTVCKKFGLSRNYFSSRAVRDREFGERLREAKEISAEARLDRIEDALWNSDISDQRANAIATHYRWLAGKLDRKTFGEKVDVDVRSVNIVVQGDTNDLC
jgi:hypothetical protein